MDTTRRTTQAQTTGASGRERVGTVIIGGGQAGLAVAQQLAERGRGAVILEANERVGDNWRRHYDSLRLYNPAWMCGLPGLAFPGDEHHFPTRDEVASYLEDYVDRFDLTVRTGTRVESVRREHDRFVVATDAGTLVADDVVVATGTFGGAHTPAFADQLDPGILQLHSSEYKRPAQLQPGPALVVGASHSGADIAHELAATRETVLVGRDTGQLPFDIDSRVARVIWPVIAFLARNVLTIRTPMGRRIRPKIRAHGGPLIRYKNADLADAGVDRAGERITGVRGGLPVVDDGRTLGVANVVWATGFRQDFSWIEPPVVGDDGWPREHRGAATDVPGLYFVGLAFQYSFASMLLTGVGRDAAHVAEHIDSRNRTAAEAPVAA